ncbi:MAG: acyltransferase [Planctomycetes bacterium]|nr:acyltransferase [Planctomycetota bacterium]
MYKNQLDGFRGILFLMVFSYHQEISHWFLTYALPCFFCLSGFLITRIVLQSDGAPIGKLVRAFFIRRALRILPIYYLVVLACWAFGLLLFPAWQLSYTFNVKLFLLSLEPETSGFHQIFKHWDFGQMHLWSMCIEEQFYLLFPFLLLATRKSWRAPALALSILASIGLRLWFRFQHPELLYGALLPICGEYILWGCLAATLSFERFRFGNPVLWTYGGALALLVLSMTPRPHLQTGFFQFIPGDLQTLFAIAITTLIVGLWHDDHSPISRFLRLGPLVFMGKISYGLYLMHMAMFDLGDWIFARVPWLAVNVNEYWFRLGLCLLFASASWYLIEKPINDLKRHFPMPRPAA